MKSRNSREYRSLLAGERLVVEATEAVHQAMERAGVNKKELASRLDVRPSEVSQRLSGRRNLTLKSFATMLEALGVRAKLEIETNDVPYMPGAKWVTPQSVMAQTVVNATNAVVIINAIRGAEPSTPRGSNLIDLGHQLTPLQRNLEAAAPLAIPIGDTSLSTVLGVGGRSPEAIEVDPQ